MMATDFEAYYGKQIKWSLNTFGPGKRTRGITEHIARELAEIRDAPDDLFEWVDVIILAMDGYWRAGGTEVDLLDKLKQKQKRNMARSWPDWRTVGDDKPIEHIKDGKP